MRVCPVTLEAIQSSEDVPVCTARAPALSPAAAHYHTRGGGMNTARPTDHEWHDVGSERRPIFLDLGSKLFGYPNNLIPLHHEMNIGSTLT